MACCLQHIGGVLFTAHWWRAVYSTLENGLALAPNKRVLVIKLFLFKNVSQFTAVTLAKRDTKAKLTKAFNISRWVYQARNFIKLLNNNYTLHV